MTSSMKRRSEVRLTLPEARHLSSRRNKPPSMPKRLIRQRRSFLPNGSLHPKAKRWSMLGRASSRKGFKSKTSMENGWGPKVKPIVVSNKDYIEDARKWLDTAVKP